MKQHEEQILNKGLNFIPTPAREHPANIMQDYLLFDRKLRLQYYFIDREENYTKRRQTIQTPNLDGPPPASQDQNFDTYRKFHTEGIIN